MTKTPKRDFNLFLVSTSSRVVKLNDTERKIFQLLRDCVKETDLPVTLRVAGGWVRDKVDAPVKFCCLIL